MILKKATSWLKRHRSAIRVNYLRRIKAKQIIFDEEHPSSLKRALMFCMMRQGDPRSERTLCRLDKKWVLRQLLMMRSYAKEIELPDPFENMGVQLVKEAQQRQMMLVAMDDYLNHPRVCHSFRGFKNIAAGADAMALKRGVEMATEPWWTN